MSSHLAGALTRPRARALFVDGRERVEANARLTAMTAVASRKTACNFVPPKAHSALTTRDGTIINANDP